MASSSGIGDVIKWGLIIGGGYLAYNLYENYVSAQTKVAPPAPGTTPTPAPSPVSYTPPTLVEQLKKAAGTQTLLNADQWTYYANAIPGRSPVPDDIFTALFFPNGRPSDPSQAPTMTAEQFVAALNSKGLSGLPVRMPLVYARMPRTGRLVLVGGRR